jgi:WD40 repeat protein
MRIILAVLILLLGSALQATRAEGQNWQVLRTLQMDAGLGGVSSVAFSPDGKRALSVGGGFRLWDLATGQTLKTMTGHSWYVRSVAFLPLGSRALSASDDKTLRL